jgi:integrase/recombinase XerD
MLDDFVTYLTDQKISKQTVVCYKSDLLRFDEFLHGVHKSLIRATSSDVQDYINHLSANDYKPRSICRIVSALSKFYKFAKKTQHITTSPIYSQHHIKGHTLNIKKPSIVRSDLHHLRQVDILKIIDSIDYATELYTLRDRALYLLMFKTGIRVPELLSVRVDDLNLTTKELTYTVLNKSYTSTLVLTDDVQPTVEHYYFARLEDDPELPGDGPLFVNRCGTLLSARSVRRHLTMHAERIGLKINPSQLRHSFAINSLRNGQTLERLQKQLRHNSTSSIKIYIDHIKNDRDLGPAAPLDEPIGEESNRRELLYTASRNSSTGIKIP